MSGGKQNHRMVKYGVLCAVMFGIVVLVFTSSNALDHLGTPMIRFEKPRPLSSVSSCEPTDPKTLDRAWLLELVERIRYFRELWKIEDVEWKDFGISTDDYFKAVAQNESFESLINTFREVLLTGRKLNIGLSGGSISTGMCVGPANLYIERLKNNLQFILGSPVVVENGAVGSIGSFVNVYCMDSFLSLEGIDLLFWEFAVNDFAINQTSCMEQELFTTKALKLQGNPQLVYINLAFIRPWLERECNGNRSYAGICSRSLMRHYRVPSMDFRSVACSIARKGRIEEFMCPMGPNAHPDIKFHTIVGSYLSRLIVNVLDEVVSTIQREMETSSSRVAETRVAETAVRDLPKPLFTTKRIEHCQCWSAALPPSGNNSPLIPKESGTWKHLIREMGWGRMDKKHKWMSTEANSTIVFSVTIDPFRKGALKLYLVINACKDCGHGKLWIDNLQPVEFDPSGKYAIGTTFQVQGKVSPGHHFVYVQASTPGLSVMALLSGYESDQ
ncbi:uncharacterized protein [Ptychodera flava]|uniref:uncharacterized protein n=1 Tax=Ptychodera flava TaxID=63121 RepID=UPI00396A3F2A